MAEFNIYDDLDLLHAQEKEKVVEDLQWKEKYEVALATIESLQTEKKNLNRKIKQLEINFATLLDTARVEIKRKDQQLDQLRRERDDICFRRNVHPVKTAEAGSNGVHFNPFAVESQTLAPKIIDTPVAEKSVRPSSRQTKWEDDRLSSRSNYQAPGSRNGNDRGRDRSRNRSRDRHESRDERNYYQRNSQSGNREMSQAGSSDSSRGKTTKDQKTDFHRRIDHEKDKHSNGFASSKQENHSKDRHASHKDTRKDAQKDSNTENGRSDDNPKENTNGIENKDNTDIQTIAALQKEILNDVKQFKKQQLAEEKAPKPPVEDPLIVAAEKSNQFIDALFDDMIMNVEPSSNDAQPVPEKNAEKIVTKTDENCNEELHVRTPLKHSVAKLFDDLFGPSPSATVSAARSNSVSSPDESSGDTVEFAKKKQENPNDFVPISPSQAVTVTVIDLTETSPEESVKKKFDAKPFKFVELNSSFYSSEDDENDNEKIITVQSQSDIESPPFENCGALIASAENSTNSPKSTEAEYSGKRTEKNVSKALQNGVHQADCKNDKTMPVESLKEKNVVSPKEKHGTDDVKRDQTQKLTHSDKEKESQNSRHTSEKTEKKDDRTRKDSHRYHRSSKPHKSSSSSSSSRSKSSSGNNLYSSGRSRSDRHHHPSKESSKSKHGGCSTEKTETDKKRESGRSSQSSRRHSKDSWHYSSRDSKDSRERRDKSSTDARKEKHQSDSIEEKKDRCIQDSTMKPLLKDDLKPYHDQVISLSLDDISTSGDEELVESIEGKQKTHDEMSDKEDVSLSGDLGKKSIKEGREVGKSTTKDEHHTDEGTKFDEKSSTKDTQQSNDADGDQEKLEADLEISNEASNNHEAEDKVSAEPNRLPNDLENENHTSDNRDKLVNGKEEEVRTTILDDESSTKQEGVPTNGEEVTPNSATEVVGTSTDKSTSADEVVVTEEIDSDCVTNGADSDQTSSSITNESLVDVDMDNSEQIEARTDEKDERVAVVDVHESLKPMGDNQGDSKGKEEKLTAVYEPIQSLELTDTASLLESQIDSKVNEKAEVVSDDVEEEVSELTNCEKSEKAVMPSTIPRTVSGVEDGSKLENHDKAEVPLKSVNDEYVAKPSDCAPDVDDHLKAIVEEHIESNENQSKSSDCEFGVQSSNLVDARIIAKIDLTEQTEKTALDSVPVIADVGSPVKPFKPEDAEKCESSERKCLSRALVPFIERNQDKQLSSLLGNRVLPAIARKEESVSSGRRRKLKTPRKCTNNNKDHFAIIALVSSRYAKSDDGCSLISNKQPVPPSSQLRRTQSSSNLPASTDADAEEKAERDRNERTADVQIQIPKEVLTSQEEAKCLASPLVCEDQIKVQTMKSPSSLLANRVLPATARKEEPVQTMKSPDRSCFVETSNVHTAESDFIEEDTEQQEMPTLRVEEDSREALSEGDPSTRICELNSDENFEAKGLPQESTTSEGTSSNAELVVTKINKKRKRERKSTGSDNEIDKASKIHHKKRILQNSISPDVTASTTVLDSNLKEKHREKLAQVVSNDTNVPNSVASVVPISDSKRRHKNKIVHTELPSSSGIKENQLDPDESTPANNAPMASESIVTTCRKKNYNKIVAHMKSIATSDQGLRNSVVEASVAPETIVTNDHKQKHKKVIDTAYAAPTGVDKQYIGTVGKGLVDSHVKASVVPETVTDNDVESIAASGSSPVEAETLETSDHRKTHNKIIDATLFGSTAIDVESVEVGDKGLANVPVKAAVDSESIVASDSKKRRSKIADSTYTATTGIDVGSIERSGKCLENYPVEACVAINPIHKKKIIGDGENSVISVVPASIGASDNTKKRYKVVASDVDYIAPCCKGLDNSTVKSSLVPEAIVTRDGHHSVAAFSASSSIDPNESIVSALSMKSIATTDNKRKYKNRILQHFMDSVPSQAVISDIHHKTKDLQISFCSGDEDEPLVTASDRKRIHHKKRLLQQSTVPEEAATGIKNLTSSNKKRYTKKVVQNSTEKGSEMEAITTSRNKKKPSNSTLQNLSDSGAKVACKDHNRIHNAKESIPSESATTSGYKKKPSNSIAHDSVFKSDVKKASLADGDDRNSQPHFDSNESLASSFEKATTSHSNRKYKKRILQSFTDSHGINNAADVMSNKHILQLSIGSDVKDPLAVDNKNKYKKKTLKHSPGIEANDSAAIATSDARDPRFEDPCHAIVQNKRKYKKGTDSEVNQDGTNDLDSNNPTGMKKSLVSQKSSVPVTDEIIHQQNDLQVAIGSTGSGTSSLAPSTKSELQFSKTDNPQPESITTSTTISHKSCVNEPLSHDENEQNSIYIKRRMKPSKQALERKKKPILDLQPPHTNDCDKSLSDEKRNQTTAKRKRSISHDKSLPTEATPTHHTIFNDDVSQADLPPVYNANEDDVQYQEIDNRMRSIFQSPNPQHSTNGGSSFELANCSATQLLDDNLKENLTIDETQNRSERSLCDTSTSSRKISVGSNDYVIETVGAHTANVFISRKKCKKRLKIGIATP